MRLSKQGAMFIGAHEGFVSRAYRCPAGVLTIGFGFTGRSRVFRDYWRKTRGHDLRPGDTLGKAEALKILPKIADAEYGAAVMKDIGPREQHHYDAATSVCFNLGPRAATWRWARALRDGDPKESARLLRTTGTTAGGRTLRGLVRRRQEEAVLLEKGDYGGISGGAVVYDAGETPNESGRAATLKRCQQALKDLGYDPGPIDGVYGPKTRAAVRAFQKSHPHLVADGVLGPATMDSLDRALKARTAPAKTAIAGAAATAVAGAVTDAAGIVSGLGNWPIVVVGVAVLAGAVFVAWCYRDEIKLWRAGHA